MNRDQFALILVFFATALVNYSLQSHHKDTVTNVEIKSFVLKTNNAQSIQSLFHSMIT